MLTGKQIQDIQKGVAIVCVSIAGLFTGKKLSDKKYRPVYKKTCDATIKINELHQQKKAKQ